MRIAVYVLAWVISLGLLAAFFLAIGTSLSIPNASLYFFGGISGCAIILAVRLRRDTLVMVASTTLTILACEVGFLVYEKLVVDPWTLSYNWSEEFITEDPVLRTRILPSVRTLESIRFGNGELMYEDVVYTSDEKGRRGTANSTVDSPSAHALFSGGSFTFGMGVPDDQTLPSAFARESKGVYRAYNYGITGAGPSQLYLQLKDASRLDDVTPREGIAVYSFIPDHLNRAAAHHIGRVLDIPNTPLFHLDENGDLVGPYRKSDDPKLHTRVRLYERLRRNSPIARLVLRVLQITYLSEHEAMDVVVRLVVESSTLYKERFGGTLYVLIWPRMQEQVKDLPYFIDGLEKKGIPVLRPAPLPDVDKAQLHPRDEHPSAAEYEWVAGQLHELLLHDMVSEPAATSTN